MRLAELVAGMPVTGSAGTDPEVSGIAYDSRQVRPGDLFVGWRGVRHDPRDFVADAVAGGAVAVIVDAPAPADVPSVVPWLEAAEPRALLAPLAARLFAHPESELTLLGVTGTNGKSTTVAALAAIWQAAGRPCAVFGTLGHAFAGDELARFGRTTPEGSDLLSAMRAARDRGAVAAAMEVSSHSLVQGRVEGLRFDAAVFTNLTRDHLDFHGGMEGYFAAKRRLFDRLKPGGRAVVNLDDPWGKRLAEELPDALTFGESGAVRLVDAALSERSTRGRLLTPRGELAFEARLLGRYNLANLWAAAATAEALELPHEAIAAGLAALAPLPGRMEPVDCGQAFPVLIDFAHTDAALEAALRSLRELSGRKVIVVFGCGGDRDPGKRPLMGRIAGRLADLPIVTSDNPRSEDPLAIIAAVEEGLRASGNPGYRVMPDRREAIRRALAVAGGGRYAVLVAGKGHEQVQLVGDRRIPFSDREEIEKALVELRDRPVAS